MSRPVPQLLVERLALGELPPARAAQVRAQLEREPGGLERLQRIAQSNAQVLERTPPRVFQARLESLSHRPRPARLWAGAALALALVLIGVSVLPDGPEPLAISEGVRVKGEALTLVVHRQSAQGVQELHQGDTARAGDHLQLSYASVNGGYGAMFSVDGAGMVTQHLPELGVRAVVLETGGLVALEHGYTLDDAPDFERFYLVQSERPFSLEPLLLQARAGTLASGPEILTLTLTKERR